MYDKYITICIRIYIIYLNVYIDVGPLAILWTDERYIWSRKNIHA